MRFTLIGPAFPWRGGLPLLTSELAFRLEAAEHHVVVRTWSVQGPARLLPAQRHPLQAPESRAFPTVREPLSWRNPLHWRRVGRRSGTSDVVILIFYTTVQAPALAAVARVARRRGSRVVVICANAVPHEIRRGDRTLMSLLMRAADAVLVHTDAERTALRRITGRPVEVAPLPPHLPTGQRAEHRPDRPATGRLLFFGKVRRYKGVDVLLRALVDVPDRRLGIVGEFYEQESELRALVARLGLVNRVDVRPGYLAAAEIPELFAQFDALVLPYRTATASQHVALAHWHGLPVVATRVGNFPHTVRDGEDGLLCAPDDPADLARAIRTLYEPGRLERLRSGIEPTDAATETTWSTYLTTIEHLAGEPTR
ncbi:glycosyltransferase family 4 protein [Pseudonocardia sp. TRM90224]|uniref:glycosyltransferase family 4 protein n=1 Tax=Pseudonocardia sp. TRM90224 TaxID=2812678 RepID=UPI001E5BE07F|nr:glycosyltransferase family 4 protein [Pseudonocardia sp. TRM90224]